MRERTPRRIVQAEDALKPVEEVPRVLEVAGSVLGIARCCPLRNTRSSRSSSPCLS